MTPGRVAVGLLESGGPDVGTLTQYGVLRRWLHNFPFTQIDKLSCIDFYKNAKSITTRKSTRSIYLFACVDQAHTVYTCARRAAVCSRPPYNGAALFCSCGVRVGGLLSWDCNCTPDYRHFSAWVSCNLILTANAWIGAPNWV